VISPTQQATNGALDIFVVGHQMGLVSQMLFGLEVLVSATESQVQTAIRFVHAMRRLPVVEIQAMFDSV
jgi:hypothetical protein